MALRRILLLAVLSGIGLSSCSPGSSTDPAATMCDGISSELGGCGDLPVFTGDTCDAVAAEYGAMLNGQVILILEGPDAVDGEARSVRLKQAMALLAVVAGQHLDEIGVGRACDLAEFRSAAEAEFSQELRDGVGAAMYDGQPLVTYDEWLVDLDDTLRVLGPE